MPSRPFRAPLLVALALLPLAASRAPAHAATEPADSIAARADRYLAARTALGRFSGAALIARGDRVILRKGYGFADVSKRTPFTPGTRHKVASVSKMFTAMAALALRDAGRLALEDSLGRWLDDCPAAWRPITVSQLVHHTSGIPDYEEPLEIGSERYHALMTRPDATQLVVDSARTRPLDFAPGTQFKYSNTGYIVLAMVVERAAGEPFARYVSRTLLAPAGMKRSGVFDGRADPPGTAVGYTHDDLGWERTLAGVALTAGHLRPVPRLPIAPPAGDAGIYSTVDDLLLWSRVMDGGTLVPPARVAEVFTPGLENYGCGWFVDRGFDRRRARHNGILPGYVSDFVKFPGDSLTLIVLSNLDRTRLDRVVRDLSAIALGHGWDMPVRGVVTTLTAAQEAPLTGTYAMGDGRKLVVRRDSDYLVAELEGRYTAGLIPLSPTEFYFPLGDGRALFTLDEAGRAARVNMRYGGEDHVATRVAQP